MVFKTFTDLVTSWCFVTLVLAVALLHCHKRDKKRIKSFCPCIHTECSWIFGTTGPWHRSINNKRIYQQQKNMHTMSCHLFVHKLKDMMDPKNFTYEISTLPPCGDPCWEEQLNVSCRCLIFSYVMAFQVSFIYVAPNPNRSYFGAFVLKFRAALDLPLKFTENQHSSCKQHLVTTAR